MKNDKTVVFDVGGTLVSSPDFFGAMAEELTGKPCDQVCHGQVSEVFLELFASQAAGAEFLSVEEMMERTFEVVSARLGQPLRPGAAGLVYRGTFLERSALFPDVLSTLRALEAAGVRLLVGSDADAPLLEEELEKLGIARFFSGKCISSIAGGYKPSARFVRHLRELLGDASGEAFMVGDSRSDIDTALALGIRPIQIDRAGAGPMSNAVVIRSLGELPAIVLGAGSTG